MPGTNMPAEALWWNRTVKYWQENQAAITFHSPVEISAGSQQVIESLHLNRLNSFLNTNGFNLKSFRPQDVPGGSEPPPPPPEQPKGSFETLIEEGIKAAEELEHAVEEVVEDIEGAIRKSDEAAKGEDAHEKTRDNGNMPSDDDDDHDHDDDDNGEKDQSINSTVGKYLFASPSGHGTIVSGFFHIESVQGASSMPGMSMMSMNGGDGNVDTQDATRNLVSLINNNLDKLRQDGEIPLVAAMPNWTSGGNNGTGPNSQIGHGCPIFPPIPLQEQDACASHPANWPFALPELSPTMQEMTGKGVKVFVLDTIPRQELIKAAASAAGSNNGLLQSMATGIDAGSIVIRHRYVPEWIATSVVTGKDIYQRLFGFRMPDHGLFVAGILHDIAPDAEIECIRVLNNYGMTYVSIIIAALAEIQSRMASGGDLHDRQVVINMSLVATPADEELANLWFGDMSCIHAEDLDSMMDDLKLLRNGLHLVIQSLVASGVVVVASAGNDSDFDIERASMASYMEVSMGMAARWKPRYPAAFPEVISVGAVDKSGQATPYSNFPALPPHHNGVATYGGGVPIPIPSGTPVPPMVSPRPAGAKTWVIVTDAVRGIYSSTHYSELSATDLPPAQYNAPANNNGWAYWSGTSFATPIISAVAARVLQRLGASVPVDQVSAKVQWAITNAAGQKALLTESANALPANSLFGSGVSVLRAEQECEPITMESVIAGTEGAVKHE